MTETGVVKNAFHIPRRRHPFPVSTGASPWAARISPPYNFSSGHLPVNSPHGMLFIKKGGDDSRPLSHILKEVQMSGGMKILPEIPP